MSSRRGPEFKLEVAARDPGFTPRREDVPELLDLLTREDAKLTELAQRALLRVGTNAAREAYARLAKAPAGLRAKLVAFIGRAAAQAPEETELSDLLMQKLDDADPKTRRNAASALGKIRRDEVEAALLSALAREASDKVRRTIVESLGKVGGERALVAIASLPESGEEELDRARAKAELMVTRTRDREAPSTFDAARSAPEATLVTLRCRRGLEELLKDELPASLSPRITSDEPLGRRVEVTLTGAPEQLFRSRTMLFFGFPLPAVRLADEGALPEALAESLSSPKARAILTHFTAGTVRYRIAWAGGGKRRAAIWRTAEEVRRRCPEFMNDPTNSTWQAVVHEGPGELRVELVPRTDDPRFTYRRGDVPAASHPTIAAALARVAGVREDDIVWDPFVGSGTELCERALAGPYKRLIGSDRDPAALSVARANLEAAGASGAELLVHDAVKPPPFRPPPTLVITNPPMGRRVHRSADLSALLDRFVENAALSLAPGGRLVWVAPLPLRAQRVAEAAGLVPFFREDVDMGGFEAQLQGFRKPESKAAKEAGKAADTRPTEQRRTRR